MDADGVWLAIVCPGGGSRMRRCLLEGRRRGDRVNGSKTRETAGRAGADGWLIAKGDDRWQDRGAAR